MTSPGTLSPGSSTIICTFLSASITGGGGYSVRHMQFLTPAFSPITWSPASLHHFAINSVEKGGDFVEKPWILGGKMDRIYGEIAMKFVVTSDGKFHVFGPQIQYTLNEDDPLYVENAALKVVQFGGDYRKIWHESLKQLSGFIEKNVGQLPPDLPKGPARLA